MRNWLLVLSVCIISFSAHSSGSNYCRSERGDVIELDLLSSSKPGIYADLVEPTAAYFFKQPDEVDWEAGTWFAFKEGVSINIAINFSINLSEGSVVSWPGSAILTLEGKDPVTIPLTCGPE